MVLNDIVNSCAHEKVAEAALLSIGGAFARRVEEAAYSAGVAPGVWAAAAIVRFRKEARRIERDALQQALCGSDQPILKGFRLIVEPTLEDEKIKPAQMRYASRRSDAGSCDLRA